LLYFLYLVAVGYVSSDNVVRCDYILIPYFPKWIVCCTAGCRLFSGVLALSLVSVSETVLISVRLVCIVPSAV